MKKHESYIELDKKPKAEKESAIHKFSATNLLNAAKVYDYFFNPLEEESCETYDIIRAEIMQRLVFVDNLRTQGVIREYYKG